MKLTDHQYVSGRGELLACMLEDVTKLDAPLLTVELYVKWYSLHLIKPSGVVQRVEFEELEEGFEGSAFVDHVPNPDAVRLFTDRKGYHLDELAEEIMVGRWHLEVAERRSTLLRLCSAIALNGNDLGAIAECVLTALSKAGFSKEEVEEHMSEDLLSYEWFRKRNIEPLDRY